MPKSLWNAAARQEVLERLGRLTPDTAARWGKMSAPQMLWHLHAWMQMTDGALPVRPRNLILRYPVVKQVVVYWLPFPRGVPTAAELIPADPVEWNDVYATLCREVESFDKLNARSEWPIHPAFGRLTPRAWGVLAWRHTDHHLRQFGV